MNRLSRFLVLLAALIAVPSASFAQSAADAAGSVSADTQVAQAAPPEHATGSAAGNKASFLSAGRLYPAMAVAGVAAVGVVAATLGSGDDEAGPPTSTSTSTSTATSTN